MSKKVLFIASNYGLWGEELQAPWDALKNAGFDLTLATPLGKTPLPMAMSMDKEFIDPRTNVSINPANVVDRIDEILDSGEWDNPLKIIDVNMDDYDALVMVGGPGSSLDLCGNPKLHQVVYDAYKENKVIGALCYAVGVLVWTRDHDNYRRSIIYGKQVVAHPREWDFVDRLNYELVRTTEDNHGTDIETQGFIFPLQVITEDAVGPHGKVFSDPDATRDKPNVVVDYPFVTAMSVESSIAYGEKLIEALNR